jgi:type I restriction enzyme S subunit
MMMAKTTKQKLPDGWRWAKLREVADVVNGFGFSESLQGRTDLPYPFIKVSDMNAPGSEIVIDKASNTVDDEILRHLGARCYPKGTVVFPKVGGALLTNKKRILGQESSFDNNIMGVVPKSIDSNFLYHWFCTIDLAEHANTQALPSIRQSLVAQFDIPLPPFSQQQRIAGILRYQIAAVEKARAATQARLEAVKALPAAFLRQVFPQPGQSLPDGWRWAKLGDVFDITSSKRVFESEWKQEGVPFYRAREIVKLSQQGFVANDLFISNEMYTEYASKYGIPKEGDIMVTGVGTLGVCYVVQAADKFYFKDGNILWLKKKSEVDSRFVEYLFRSTLMKKQINDSAGTTVGTFTIIKAKNSRIPLPNLLEQQRITAILKEQISVVEKARAAAEAELDTINALPAALLHQVFNGEI